MRANRDRRLLSRRADDVVGLVGILARLIIDLRQAGIKDTRAAGSVNRDGHGGLPAVVGEVPSRQSLGAGAMHHMRRPLPVLRFPHSNHSSNWSRGHGR